MLGHSQSHNKQTAMPPPLQMNGDMTYQDMGPSLYSRTMVAATRSFKETDDSGKQVASSCYDLPMLECSRRVMFCRCPETLQPRICVHVYAMGEATHFHLLRVLYPGSAPKVLVFDKDRLESLNEPEAEVSYLTVKLSAEELRGHKLQALSLEATARDKVSSGARYAATTGPKQSRGLMRRESLLMQCMSASMKASTPWLEAGSPPYTETLVHDSCPNIKDPQQHSQIGAKTFTTCSNEW